MFLSPVISGFSEIVSTFLRGDGIEDVADGVANGVGGSRGRLFVPEWQQGGAPALMKVRTTSSLAHYEDVSPKRPRRLECDPAHHRTATIAGLSAS
jgi:hypothetical protein